MKYLILLTLFVVPTAHANDDLQKELQERRAAHTLYLKSLTVAAANQKLEELLKTPALGEVVLQEVVDKRSDVIEQTHLSFMVKFSSDQVCQGAAMALLETETQRIIYSTAYMNCYDKDGRQTYFSK
jgi:hypothetical protein